MKYWSKHLALAICVGGCLSAIGSRSASAETLTRTLSYFTIGGTKPEDIEQQLTRLGPEIDATKSRHPGATRIEFSNKVTYASTPRRCSVSAAAVHLDVTVILPRWRKRLSADMPARLYWDALSADIRRHEESHLVIARNHARQIERTLVKLPARSNCEAMATAVKAVQEKILAAHEAEQERFDRIEAKTLDKRLIGKLQRRIDQLTDKKKKEDAAKAR